MKRIWLNILACTLVLAAFASLGWRCFYLQYCCAETYGQSLVRQTVTVDTPAQRGLIMDARNNCVALSKVEEYVYLDPKIIDNPSDVAARIAPVLEMPAVRLEELIESNKSIGKRYIRLPEPISQIQHDQIEQEQKGSTDKEKIRGIGLEERWERFYPLGNLYCHVAGFAGAENKGLVGLELKYDRVLRGKASKNVFIADAYRRPIGAEGQIEFPEMGASIILTIDTVIQKFTHEALSKKVAEYNAESGVAVVMNPNNGEILAMVSLPDFDPQSGEKDPDAMRNRIISDPYEPGSIFKPLIVAAALDAKKATRHEKIDCEYGLYAGKGFGRIQEYGRHSYGNLTLREILIHSSNIGMAKLGQRMGKQKLYDAVKKFGFGQKTGIDLPLEDAGILNRLSRWTGYSVTRIPYGQEIAVTAIQIARSYCILANGGRPVTPHVVKAFCDPNGKTVVFKDNFNDIAYVLKPDVCKYVVSDCLTAVVKEGTGKKAAVDGYSVWGKTGTANIALPNGRGFDNKNYVASFAGGVPADKPKLVVLVSIRKPDRSLGKGYTGGTVAGPVVQEILEKTLKYLNIPPDEAEED